MPINIRQGETENEFISRCIGEEVSSGKEQDVSAAICYSYWRKDKMSKLRTSQEKFSAKLKYSQDFRGINLTNFGENSDACWEGYIQVGTKILDGREVPDCRGPVDEMETQPTISSTYPGEPMSGSVKLQECPPATLDINLNLKNRQYAIENAMYGPLDIKNPGNYWDKIAQQWEVPVEEAKGEICGNCAAFNITKRVLDCIAEGISGGEPTSDAWDVIEAGDLGYCEIYKFKCNANRSCFAHVDGGPIKD
jgi:hypothetical protein